MAQTFRQVSGFRLSAVDLSEVYDRRKFIVKGDWRTGAQTGTFVGALGRVT
jgi:hypothetical protein